MVGDRDRALDAGFDHYLTKPIDPETFTEEINARLPEHLRGTVPTPAGVEPAPTADAAADARTGSRSRRPTSSCSTTPCINQTLLRSMLEPHGYHVRTAFTVEEAIAAAEDEATRSGAVRRPRGPAVRRRTAVASASVPMLAVVPFAFITATTDWQDPLIGDGTTRVIRRPIDPAALLDEVKALLSSRTGG